MAHLDKCPSEAETEEWLSHPLTRRLITGTGCQTPRGGSRAAPHRSVTAPTPGMIKWANYLIRRGWLVAEAVLQYMALAVAYSLLAAAVLEGLIALWGIRDPSLAIRLRLLVLAIPPLAPLLFAALALNPGPGAVPPPAGAAAHGELAGSDTHPRAPGVGAAPCHPGRHQPAGGGHGDRRPPPPPAGDPGDGPRPWPAAYRR